MGRPIVFSGIQPTGAIHIGNYFGAIKHWVAGQDDAENIFCLVDMHALTVPQDPAVLHAAILETATVLLAAGIDQAKSRLFVQSQVSEHGELAWYLSCVASMGQLQRMTQFKEKSDAQRGEVRVGLFTYPVLMAADILLYRTTHVPVGEDQKQHIELTRDLAGRFNAAYGEIFVMPEPAIPKAGARIMGLDDPTKKMSKSAPGSYHAVRVLDTPDQIKKAVMSAQTDSGRDVRADPARPGVTNPARDLCGCDRRDRRSGRGALRERARVRRCEKRAGGDSRRDTAPAARAVCRTLRRSGGSEGTARARSGRRPAHGAHDDGCRQARNGRGIGARDRSYLF